MKKYLYLLIFWLQYFCAVDNAVALELEDTALTANHIRKHPEQHGYLKKLIENLQNQEWTDNEAQCLKLLTKIMINVQNSTLWATWIWDSMQNPVGHLYGSRNNFGNYDECLEFPWEQVDPDMRTQYCLAHIHLSDVDLEVDEVDLFGNVNNYIRAKTKHHLKFNTLNWGICTPVACKPQAVAKFVGVMFKQTHIGLTVNKLNIFVDHCDTAGDKKVSYKFGYYFTISLLVFVTLFTLMATRIVNSNILNQTSDFLKAFDIPTNIQSLMKVTDNDVRCLFGIRVISSCIVTGMHVFWLMNSGGVSNALSLDKDYDINTTIIYNLEMVVDTFLFMSGFLMIRGVMKDGLEKFNPLKIIVKRYTRIAWLLCVILLIFVNLLEHTSRGPAMKVVLGQEIDACHKNWWASLLLIQNYFDPENMCHPVVWSAAVDFHLSVLATMMSWVFWKNMKYGLLLFTIGFIMSIAMPAALVFSDYRRYPPLAVDFRLTDDYRSHIFSNETYISTHFRASSYFVGMAVGYIIFKYNPVTHRNIINKKNSVLAFCLFLVMFLGSFIISDMVVKYDYSPVEAAIHLSLRRIIWAILIAILVMICEYGTLPLVNGFLSWYPWTPISKLTTGVYLVHSLFGYYFCGASRNSNQYNLLGFVVNALGITVISGVVSLFLWTFIEAPMKNLTSLLFKSVNKRVRQDTIKKYNGHETNDLENVCNKKTK